MTAAPDAAAFCSARRASSPQQEPRMARFSPALDRALSLAPRAVGGTWLASLNPP